MIRADDRNGPQRLLYGSLLQEWQVGGGILRAMSSSFSAPFSALCQLFY